MDERKSIQVKKCKDGRVMILNHFGVVLAMLTKEQARSLADVLIAATKESE